MSGKEKQRHRTPEVGCRSRCDQFGNLERWEEEDDGKKKYIITNPCIAIYNVTQYSLS